MIEIKAKNPVLNLNDGATLVALRAQECGEIDQNHEVMRVAQRGAGIIEVLTRAKGQRNPNMFYRFLIDGYTGKNLNGKSEEGIAQAASWLKEGLDGPTHRGQVSIESDNAALAVCRLMDAGFREGYLLRIHRTGWANIGRSSCWNTNFSVLKDFDFRS